jgi:hypothetical protein
MCMCFAKMRSRSSIEKRSCMSFFNRLFFFAGSMLFILQSCGVTPVNKKNADSVLSAKKDSVSDSGYWATQGKLIPDEDIFYPVYELSSKTQAIVFEVTYDPAYTQMDSLMQDIVHSGVYYDEMQNPELVPIVKHADTLGRFDLLQSKEVTKKLAAFLEGEFYIYCTKGIVKRKMKDVLFCANMCQSSIFALRFDRIDTAAYGHPLMASRNNKAVLTNDIVAENLIDVYNDSIVKTFRDYLDTLPPKVFARKDSILFVYYDDFLWPMDRDNRNCFFPGRVQYVIGEGNKVSLLHWDNLDLFGVPCD